MHLQLLVQYEIYRLKKFFNRHFELLRNAKSHSLKKMEDRNERIREIYYYLKLNLDIVNEKWRILEDPMQIFTVTRDEVYILLLLQQYHDKIRKLKLHQFHPRNF